MKLRFFALLAIICTIFCSQISLGAELLDETFQKQLELSGADTLLENLPSKTEDILEELGLEEISFMALLSLTPREFIAVIGAVAVDELTKPLMVFASVLGVVMLCALLDGLRDMASSESVNTVFSIVAALCVAAALASPVVVCIRDTAEAIQNCATFMLAFIPILTGVLIAGGQPLTGASFNVFMFTGCEVAAQLTANVLIPMLGIYLALSLVASTMPDIKIVSAAEMLKKTIVWTLGLILSLFIGLMSVQSIVANSADTATTKATKYLIGSFVPVVGGAISDAFMATQGCIRMLKSTLGGFGIVVAAVIFLPILIRTVIWYGLINLSAAIGDILGVKNISSLMKSFSSALGMLISLILSFSLMVITATTIILMLGLGG